MIFKSTTGQNTYVSLTSGHTCIVTPEGTDIDAIYHKQAAMQGCLPAGAEVPVPQVPGGGYNPKQVIRDTFIKMLADKNPADFNANGTPKLARLNELTGIHTTRAEFEVLTDELLKAEL